MASTSSKISIDVLLHLGHDSLVRKEVLLTYSLASIRAGYTYIDSAHKYHQSYHSPSQVTGIGPCSVIKHIASLFKKNSTITYMKMLTLPSFSSQLGNTIIDSLSHV